MLNFGIALIVVICVGALCFWVRIIITMKTQKELRKRKALSMRLNGYSYGYIANALGVTVDEVKEVTPTQ